MEFDLLKATILALIQGLTEFLPISSSAHLILPSAILGWDDQGLAFDVAVHLGTLLALVVYFRTQLYRLLAAWLGSFTAGGSTADSRLAWMIFVATLPAVVAGFLFEDVVDRQLRNVTVIATTTLVFAVVLLYSDIKSGKNMTLDKLSWKSCLIIGFAQALALVPGTSRSGITMTAALLCNMDRESASRFSFLMAVPVILGAALLLGLQLVEAPSVNWFELAYAMSLSAVSALICIHFFLHFINKIGFLPFVIYRLILGSVLFIFFSGLI